MSDSLEMEGLLQTSHNFLASGTKNYVAGHDDASHFHRYSRVIISIENKPSAKPFDIVKRYLRRQRTAYFLIFSSLLFDRKKVPTTIFESRYFQDFFWQKLFAKTLPPQDFSIVSDKNYRICAIPWNTMQTSGLNSLKFLSKPVYPLLDTQGIDIFIVQTPYPGRVDSNTTLVVRYHDAFPVLMPHTVANKSRHEATHYYALMSNVRSGAYFACVSEASRQDLLRLFPEVLDRAITIHNMVSHHFFDDGAAFDRVRHIVRSRLNLQRPECHPVFCGIEEQECFYKKHLQVKPFKYLLVVSTIEPRKNHNQLIAAWEIIRSEIAPDLKLVMVGSFGWDFESIMRGMRPWIDQGALFVLSDVPAEDLRVLYQHAAATVCPSLAEGFDFAGVESMRSGGVVIASDIPVHREIYADAAEYFDPYNTDGLVDAISKVLFEDDSVQIQESLRIKGREVSARYLPENILPQWVKFLKLVRPSTASH